MKLAVDTNILVSFFRPNPVQELILKSRQIGIVLFTSKENINELKKNESAILKYSKSNSKQFIEKLDELLKFIKLVDSETFYKFEPEAKQLAPHEKDTPIFALALSLNSPIWSNEPAFKDQAKIKVLSTLDMIDLFS